MELIYRGHAYEYRAHTYAAQSPTITEIETDQTGTFLGRPFKLKQFKVAQRRPDPYLLSYRGVSYIR